MTNQEFNDYFRKRTKSFALKVIRFLETIPSNPTSRIITYQLGKAGTSVGANFRAFCRGRSKNESFSKICITVEEADESIYWLEMCMDLELGDKDLLIYLLGEGEEILKVTSSIKNSLYPTGL